MKKLFSLFLEGMRNPKMFAAVVILLVLSPILGNLMYQRDKAKHAKNDTTHVVVYDTITRYDVVPRDSVIVRYKTATLPRVVKTEAVNTSKGRINPSNSAHNSALSPDSCTVEVPIFTYHFADSNYSATISGYDVTLDKMEVYRQKEWVYVREKSKPWGVGVQIGCTYNGKVKPYVGVGVTYNIIRW